MLRKRSFVERCDFGPLLRDFTSLNKSPDLALRSPGKAPRLAEDGVGLAAGAASTRLLERLDASRTSNKDQQTGPSQEAIYERVSEIVYIQPESGIPEMIDANNQQILFDKENGILRFLNEAGQELYNSPLSNIKGVFVSTDRTSLTFIAKADRNRYGVPIWSSGTIGGAADFESVRLAHSVPIAGPIQQ
jgi:hypothetical protein